jgi:hypothetical protein
MMRVLWYQGNEGVEKAVGEGEVGSGIEGILAKVARQNHLDYEAVPPNGQLLWSSILQVEFTMICLDTTTLSCGGQHEISLELLVTFLRCTLTTESNSGTSSSTLF